MTLAVQARYVLSLFPGQSVEVVVVAEKVVDLAVVIYGPRKPFVLTNKMTGERFAYGEPLHELQALSVDTISQQVVTVDDGKRTPAYRHFTSPYNQLGWFSLKVGRNEIVLEEIAARTYGALQS